MRIFRLTADAEFIADNLDDALGRLAKHFEQLVETGESELFTYGHISVKPAEEQR